MLCPTSHDPIPPIPVPFVPPFAARPALRTLAAHAVPRAEVVDVEAGTHTRLVDVGGRSVPVTTHLTDESVRVAVADPDPAAVATAVAAVRRWLDLDHDPAAVAAALGHDPLLSPLVRRRPGLRVVGHPDGFEAAVVTVLGQQVSLAAARTFAGRLAAAFGEPGPGGLTRFPGPETLARPDPEVLRQATGVTGARARTLSALARACAEGLRLAPDGDDAVTRARLLALPGVGPWTVEYLAVRVLGDRDALPAGDLVLRRRLGARSSAEVTRIAEPWRPWRAYGVVHLWTDAVHS